MMGICKARYQSFGCAGNASKVGKIYSLDEMSQKYQAGELDQKIS